MTVLEAASPPLAGLLSLHQRAANLLAGTALSQQFNTHNSIAGALRWASSGLFYALLEPKHLTVELHSATMCNAAGVGTRIREGFTRSGIVEGARFAEGKQPILTLLSPEKAIEVLEGEYISVRSASRRLLISTFTLCC